jgi:hypothetical protein
MSLLPSFGGICVELVLQCVLVEMLWPSIYYFTSSIP